MQFLQAGWHSAGSIALPHAALPARSPAQPKRSHRLHHGEPPRVYPPESATRAAARCRRPRLSAPGPRSAAAGLWPPQPRPRSHPAGAGLGVPPRRPHSRPSHLLLQQRKGCARVDPQVFGGGLPVVSQVCGPVPHHEEVQELQARGEGWGLERLWGEDAPARPGPGRSPLPGIGPTAPSFTCPLLSLMPPRLPLCAFGPRRGC